jgi:aspartate/methionine/tyrosine aminotransferase
VRSTELVSPGQRHPGLRSNIAALYQGAGADNVLVTIGAAEANYIATQTLLAPGDEAVVMIPIPAGRGITVWAARSDVRSSDARWAPDLDSFTMPSEQTG